MVVGSRRRDGARRRRLPVGGVTQGTMGSSTAEGGGATSASDGAGQVGGAGAQGCILLEEYT